MKKKYLECGKVVGVHGIKGEMKTEFWFDDFQHFKSVKTVYFNTKDEKGVKVISIRPYNSLALMKIEGINSPEEAMSLRMKSFYVKREDVIPDEDRVLIADIIGLPVIDGDSGKEYGTLFDVIDNGASEILDVRGKDGKQFLFPKINNVVDKITCDSEVITVHPLEGLLDEV